MSLSEDAANRGTLQKMGSAGFLLGVILVTVGSLLLPPEAIPSTNWQEELAQVGAKAQLLQACALLLAAGYWGAMVGFAAIYQSVDGPAAAWARVGFYFFIIGTALWTIGMSLDISYPAAIVNWLAAPEATKDIAFGLVLGIPAFGRGLFPIEVIVIWLSYTLLGIAMTPTPQYHPWLGRAGWILGTLGVILGISQVFTGRETSFLLYIALLGITLLWWLALGIWTARRAW
jgi:hypothetical protein